MKTCMFNESVDQSHWSRRDVSSSSYQRQEQLETHDWCNSQWNRRGQQISSLSLMIGWYDVLRSVLLEWFPDCLRPCGWYRHVVQGEGRKVTRWNDNCCIKMSVWRRRECHFLRANWAFAFISIMDGPTGIPNRYCDNMNCTSTGREDASSGKNISSLIPE